MLGPVVLRNVFKNRSENIKKLTRQQKNSHEASFFVTARKKLRSIVNN